MQDTPNALIIIGITGDLSTRKLLPSLIRLEKNGLLDDDLHIVGTSRRNVDVDSIFEDIKDSDDLSNASLTKLKKRITIVQADVGEKAGTDILKVMLDDLLPKICRTKLFYFAIPPSALQGIIKNLVRSEVHTCGGDIASRLLIEKPFGRDLHSATELSSVITDYFGSESIYSIDHYLAKETVQNVLYLRFHNPILHHIWSTHHIKSIQIDALESLDIQGRGDFYEQTGALRDMLQSHLMQLLATVTMDEPKTMQPDDIRPNRLALLKQVSLSTEVQPLRAQYEGYKAEVNNSESAVETYASIELAINTNRWQGVPITLTAGKAMKNKKTEIKIVFESHTDHKEENTFVFQIQPNEGLSLGIAVKKSGLQDGTKTINLEYCYDTEQDQFSDGYDRILHDALVGDQTLFPSTDEILNNWKLFQPVLDTWQDGSDDLIEYPQGSEKIVKKGAQSWNIKYI